MASIDDRLEHDVEGWRPEPGDVVTGVIVGIDSRESDYGQGEYPVLEIERSDGTGVLVFCFHSVLKNEIARVKPSVGDTIGIKYSGKKTAKRTDAKGNPVEFEAYRVVVERATGNDVIPDWDAMAADAQTEAPDALALHKDEEPF